MDGHKRQREQSAKMIEDALFELMKEKDFARITISEIAKRADVGRRTFYRLYTGKEEVLHAWFDKLCREYKDSYPPLARYDFRFSQMLCKYNPIQLITGCYCLNLYIFLT